MSPEAERPQAPYVRVAAQIRERIVNGELAPGDRVPNILAAELVPAPDDVAHALDIDIDVGAVVVIRHRVTYLGAQPLNSSTSWFTEDVGASAPLLLERERIRQGTARYMQESTGRTVGDRQSDHLARLGTEAEAAELGLGLPFAILETRHTAWDTTGRPLTYEVCLAPQGHILTYNHGSES